YFDWAHGPLHRSRQNAYLSWLKNIAPETYDKIFPRQANPDDTKIPASQRSAVCDLPDHLSFNTWVGQQAQQHLSEEPFFGIASFVVGQSMGASSTIVEPLDLRALHQADAALAAILQALPKNTVVTVTSGRGNADDAATPFPLQEAAIKVPLLVCPPGPTTRTIRQAVSTIDIAPTLYELANIRSPQRIQGNSLISAPPRGWSLSRLRHPDMPHQSALVSRRWKLVTTHGAPGMQLYDIQADPEETQNLARAPGRQADLEAMLDLMIDARVALEDRTEPRIAKF
ncbi:sulfatase-like hydrolase/transferase, partial [Rhodobacteraceae bacterium]|nr:sulfatase-like hydrolase/transferase [Paracoccaceae bacterium]